MRINDLVLGYNPVRTPLFSMDLNRLPVEGIDTSAWPRGAAVPQIPVTIFVRDTVGTGGNVVGSQAATEALCRQAEELIQNRELNHPAFIKWNENRDVPHDGWYVVSKFQPDYTTTQSGTIKVAAEVMYIAPGSTNRIGVWRAGGATAAAAFSLGVNYQDVPVTWVPVPLNSTPLGLSISRTGAEGALSIVTNPLANPMPLVPGASAPDLFKGGVRVFDTMLAGGNTLPAYLISDGFEGTQSGPLKNLWKSLGTDATGTLNFWTQLAGAWSIAANVASITGNGQMQGGHAEWGDVVYTVRVQCPAAGTNAEALIRSVDASNFVGAYINTGTLGLEKTIGGINTSVATAASIQTAGTWYWIVVIVSGTSYRADLFLDNAGAIDLVSGTVANVTGTIADAAVQTAKVGLRVNGAAACSFGGAFANVCLVQGSGPWGWTTYVNSGEPAFAWSTAQAHSGTSSASISCLANANGVWYLNAPALATPYTYSFWAKGGTTGTLQFSDSATQTIQTAAPLAAWQQVSSTVTPTQGMKSFSVVLSGTGTAYFDDIVVQTVPAPGAYFPTSWIEVKDRKHRFVGDMVITNGLIAEVFQAASGITAQPSVYFWNTVASTPGWQYVSSLAMQDNSGNTGGLYQWRLVRVGFFDAVAECEYYSTVTGQGGLFTHRVLAGAPFVTFDLKPKGWSSTNKNLLVVQSLYPAKLFAIDNGFIDQNLPSPSNPSYGSNFGTTSWWTPTPSMPAIQSLLFQLVPGSANQGWANTPSLIGIGDQPTSNSVTRYGYAVVPFANVTTLHTEGEQALGSLGAPWVSTVVPVNTANSNQSASRQAAAKLPSGTATGQTYTVATLTGLGGYGVQVAFRVKVLSTGSAVAQFRFQLWDVTAGTSIDSIDKSPSQITSNFVPTNLGSPSDAIPAGHTIALRIITLAATTTDFLLDSAVVRPVATPNGTGMRDLWDQFIADDTRRLEVAA